MTAVANSHSNSQLKQLPSHRSTVSNHLWYHMLHFQPYAYAFSADIEKAFLHVQLDECDTNCTHFLWLSNPQDPNSPFQPYCFKVVLFGASCSQCSTHIPLTATPITSVHQCLKKLFVDNVVSGCDTEQDAIQYFLES